MLHVGWRPLHIAWGSLHVSRGPLHVPGGSLHVTRWGPVHPTWGWPLHVAHPMHAPHAWHVAVCPGRVLHGRPHPYPTLHGSLWAHHIPLRGHHATLRWRPLASRRGPHHSSRWGALHVSRGPLHPSGSGRHAVRPLGAHVSVGAGVPLHALGPMEVRWTHHALRRPLVVLGPWRGAHLARTHERSLHDARAHGGPHVVGHLLRGHGLGEALRRWGHGSTLARERWHGSLWASWGRHVPVHLIHTVHLHLLGKMIQPIIPDSAYNLKG